jgi:hypothetical protein
MDDITDTDITDADIADINIDIADIIVTTPPERWRPIPDFEGRYEVSSLGRVRTVARTVIRSNGYKYSVQSRIRRPQIDHASGLVFWALATGRRGHYRQVWAHKLMAEVFGDTEAAA